VYVSPTSGCQGLNVSFPTFGAGTRGLAEHEGGSLAPLFCFCPGPFLLCVCVCVCKCVCVRVRVRDRQLRANQQRCGNILHVCFFVYTPAYNIRARVLNYTYIPRVQAYRIIQRYPCVHAHHITRIYP